MISGCSTIELLNLFKNKILLKDSLFVVFRDHLKLYPLTSVT